MHICEMESRILNMSLSDELASKLIYGDRPVKNLNEALTFINELKRALTSSHLQNK